MSYIPTEWKNGDIITADKLNKIENGISNAGGGTGILFATVDLSTASLDKTWQEIASTNVTYIIMGDGVTTMKLPVVDTVAADNNTYYVLAIGAAEVTGEGDEPEFQLQLFVFKATSADGYPKFAM